MDAEQTPFLSVIVIGRNQRDAVLSCCASVFEALRAADVARYELLYVDSKSSDGSIDAVRKSFGSAVTILSLHGAVNAAIGRNAGAHAAKGSALFFVDGDCEIDPGFLPDAYNDREGLTWPLVSGGVRELLYDRNGARCGEIADRYDAKEFRRDRDLGGIFLVDAGLFRRVSGFDNRYRSAEEMDLLLRLAPEKVLVTRLPRLIATHHTVSYFDTRRIFERFEAGVHRFDGLLYREHLGDPRIWRLMFIQQRFTMVLLAALLAAVLVHPALFAIYPLSIVAKYLRFPAPGYLNHLLQTFLRDAAIAWGFLFFFPQRDTASHTNYSILR